MGKKSKENVRQEKEGAGGMRTEPTGLGVAKTSQKAKKKMSKAVSSEENLNDERFLHLKTDPRFRPIPVKERKFQIDSRFSRMFTDERFQLGASGLVDKKGRKLEKSNSAWKKPDDDLKRFYREGSSDEDESGEEEEEDESSDESDDELVTGGTKRPDFARGEAELESSSSSEDESVDEEDVVEHPWGELDADAPRGDCGGARRLAVCHMDWDRVNAKDLMVIFSSFVRPGGSVKKVTIYPSEFGKRRMADEERYGPAEFLEDRDDESDDEEEEDDGGEDEDTEDEKMAEKIRRYQLSRLKYFYAIVECDSAGTADALYEECDGKEFESSAARLDLRLVPESETFDEEEARDSCDQLPDVGKYNPKFFITTALQQAKVCCTWDEDDVHRKNLIGQVFEEGANVDALEDDLKAYLGTDSE
ncbi:unnamed protein product, partial [Cyprideis torosa]